MSTESKVKPSLAWSITETTLGWAVWAGVAYGVSRGLVGYEWDAPSPVRAYAEATCGWAARSWILSLSAWFNPLLLGARKLYIA